MLNAWNQLSLWPTFNVPRRLAHCPGPGRGRLNGESICQVGHVFALLRIGSILQSLWSVAVCLESTVPFWSEF